MDGETAARSLLMWGVIPLWILAGPVDWACHRRSRIETTSGLPENLFHWALALQTGLALLAIALLQVNAGVLAIVLGVFLAHEATTYLELRDTVPKRAVRPFEQMVHSFQELLPLLALALLAVMAWGQLRPPDAQGGVDLGLRWKDQPWPRDYLAGLLLAVALFNLLPLAEESWRCWRRRRAA